MVTVLWVAAFGAILRSTTTANELCGQSNHLIFTSPGNVSITGILNVHSGEQCDVGVGGGLEHAAAAIWTVALLNHNNYIPGLQIGLSIFDGCSNKDEQKKSLVQSLLMENCLKPDTVTLGTFTTPDMDEALQPLASSLNESVGLVRSLLDSASLITMAGDLLREMSFTTIHRLIADSQPLLNQFSRKMAEEGICIYDQVLITDTHAINNEVLQPPEETDEKLVSKGPPVIFVMAESSKITTLYENLGPEMLKLNEIVWLLAPTDSALQISDELVPNRTFTLSAILPKSEDLEMLIGNPGLMSDPMNHRLPSKSPFFLAVASTILNILSPLKEIQNKSCNNVSETCSQVFEFLGNVTSGRITSSEPHQASLTSHDITHVLNTLKIPIDDEMFLMSVTEKFNSDDVAVFEMFDQDSFTINPTLLIIKERGKRSIVRVGIEDIERRESAQETSTTTTTTTKTTEGTNIEIVTRNSSEKHPCHEASGDLSSSCGICLNFVKYLSKVAHQEKQTERDVVQIGWRFETWVSVNVSVAAIGVLCAIAVFVFIMARICMGDILEGSPALSFFLLIAIVLSYTATLPYSFESSGTQGDLLLSSIICDLRVAGPPLSYSILFSILLSRSVMLAASDQDGGFMSHVNGYLQALLIFFTCAVQFATSAEYWLFNSFVLNPSTSCQSMYDTNRFMLLLSYDLFLLILVMSVIPFMMRSKRNYKEGLFFSIAVIVVFLLWSTWIPLFYLLPSSYHDATVILGLTGTATTILVCIFIPRTYLMTTAIVRDRIANTLPPLAHSEHQFRSTQALYDTLNLGNKVGATNPNFYAVNPTDSGPSTPQIRPGEYYSSESALKVPTPKRIASQPRITVRAETPDPGYQDFESPANTPKGASHHAQLREKRRFSPEKVEALHAFLRRIHRKPTFFF